jgi:hypothetical protein
MDPVAAVPTGDGEPVTVGDLLLGLQLSNVFQS